MLWFYCDDTTGAILSGGMAPNEDAAKMQPGREGATLYVVPDGSIDSPFAQAPDFSRLRDHLRAVIDEGAGAFRARFVTDIPGQAQTYEKKEAEARRWTDGDEVANPDRYPFMLTEAQVRGIPIAQVRGEIMEQVGHLTPLAALIEAHRVAAKQDILAASTLPAIIAASVVDWGALLPGGGA